MVDLAKQGNLKIEQVLPFIPDFVEIDDLKETLMVALNSHSDALATLKSELENVSNSAEEIRDEIKQLKKRLSNSYDRYVAVPVTKVCDLTGEILLKGKFMAFGCGHAFGFNALMNECLKDPIKAAKLNARRMDDDSFKV